MPKLKANLRVRLHTCIDEYDIVVCVGEKVMFEGLHDWWERKSSAIRAAQKISKETGISYNDEILNEEGC